MFSNIQSSLAKYLVQNNVFEKIRLFSHCQSSQVKVLLVRDCLEMSKSYHREIKITERIPIAKVIMVRCINFL